MAKIEVVDDNNGGTPGTVEQQRIKDRKVQAKRYRAKRGAAAKSQKLQRRDAGAPDSAPGDSSIRQETLDPDAPARVEGPLQDFFDACGDIGFVYDPRRGAHEELNRLFALAKHQGMVEFDREGVTEELNRALVEQFNFRFGTNVNDLANWQAICATLGIEPIPDQLNDAKEAVFNTHINLVDLTTAYTGIRSMQKFPTEKALSDYTLKSRPKKIFWRSLVHEGTLLWTLLRRIYRPPPEGSRRDHHNRIVRM